MNTGNLLERVRALGGRLEARGDHLHVEAPAPLPEPLLEELKANKPAILATLTTLQPSDDLACKLIAEAETLGVTVRLNPGSGPAFFARPRSRVTTELEEKLQHHTMLITAELIRRRWPCKATGCEAEGMRYVTEGGDLVLYCERHAGEET